MYICKRRAKYPCGGGDIGDNGDIFRKSLKLLDFLRALDGDIPGDIFVDGDKSPSSPSCDAAEVFPIWKQFRIQDLPYRNADRPTFARKKSLTSWVNSASSRVSLSTDSAFFAAGCCDSRGPLFRRKGTHA